MSLQLHFRMDLVYYALLQRWVVASVWLLMQEWTWNFLDIVRGCVICLGCETATFQLLFLISLISMSFELISADCGRQLSDGTAQLLFGWNLPLLLSCILEWRILPWRSSDKTQVFVEHFVLVALSILAPVQIIIFSISYNTFLDEVCNFLEEIQLTTCVLT